MYITKVANAKSGGFSPKNEEFGAQYIPLICEKYGDLPGIFLLRIYHWIKFNEKCGKNFRTLKILGEKGVEKAVSGHFTYNTMKAWAKSLRWSFERTRYVIDGLRKAGVIFTYAFEKSSYDRTLSYTIDKSTMKFIEKALKKTRMPFSAAFSNKNTSEISRNSGGNGAFRKQYDEAFLELFEMYPGHRRADKNKAYGEWQKLDATPETVEEIKQGLKKWQRSEQWQKGYVPNLEKFLREKQWQFAPEGETSLGYAASYNIEEYEKYSIFDDDCSFENCEVSAIFDN